MKDFEYEIILQLLQQYEVNKSIFLKSEYEEELYLIDGGYHLKLKNIDFPDKGVFLDEPDVFGKLDGIDVYFSGLIQGNYLILECVSSKEKITLDSRNKKFDITKKNITSLKTYATLGRAIARPF